MLDFVFFSRLLFRIKTHSKVLNKILLNLIIVSFVGSMAQAADFEQVDQLIKNRQYETAFRVLHEKDKRYTNPTYVSKMAYLAINYNAQCMMGRVFSFENLEGDETLESIRSKQGTHKVYPFELEKHLNNLIRRHPKNLELKLALADYYYSGICGISENKINRAEALYDSVYGKADFTANSLQNYGILKLKAKNDSLAIKAFQEALALNDNLATSHYNLAITLKDPEVLDKALAHGLKAVELYTDKKSKSEAALVVAGIYAELNDAENAITYAKIADAEKYMNYPLVYKSILDVYLKLNDMKLADDVADRLLAMQPENVSMAESVLTSYVNNGKSVEFFKFQKRNKSKYRNNKAALGNLWVQEGRYYLEVEKDLPKAKKAYEQARKEFIKSNMPDHPAFKSIDQILAYIKENIDKN